MICSGVSMCTGQNPIAAPTSKKAPIGTSFNVAVGNGVAMINPARNEDRSITSCLGLTQTTLSGIPRLDQRLVSLNQRILTTPEEWMQELNESDFGGALIRLGSEISWKIRKHGQFRLVEIKRSFEGEG